MVPSAILVVPDTSSRVRGAAEGDACICDQTLALISVLNRPLVVRPVEEMVELGVERLIVIVERRIIGPVTDAVVDIAPAGVSISFYERSRSVPLLEAISEVRRRLGPGPFILAFADYLNRGEIRAALDPGRALGDHDAVALMSRFSGVAAIQVSAGRDGEPTAASGKRGLPSEHFAGVFLLGAGFPAALDGPEERRSTPMMAAALEHMEGAGGIVKRRYVTDWWRHRGEPDPTLEMNRFMLAALKEQPSEAQILESSLEGAVQCDPTARIVSSVVRGPVVIGPDATVEDAFVGPHTVIGRGVLIQGAEVENSVVLEASSVSFVGERLDSSVIGPKATVSRDFRIPRRMRIKVGRGAEIALR